MTPTGGDPLGVNQHIVHQERRISDAGTQVRYRCQCCGKTCKIPSGFYHIQCGGEQ